MVSIDTLVLIDTCAGLSPADPIGTKIESLVKTAAE